MQNEFPSYNSGLCVFLERLMGRRGGEEEGKKIKQKRKFDKRENLFVVIIADEQYNFDQRALLFLHSGHWHHLIFGCIPDLAFCFHFHNGFGTQQSGQPLLKLDNTAF